MLVATAGHVDHGKTILVKSLTGVDTDRLPEEKARGLSIDIGFAYRELGDEASTDAWLGFVDVPGHERFVRNMLAGVAAIDLALLVVAADDGPMPQTLEHLAILDLLGVGEAMVVVTKIDRVDPERVEEVATEVSLLLESTRLADSPVYPVSGITGEGIPALESALIARARAFHARAAEGEFRLAVDRCFSVAGAGLVVTGAVFSGEIATGDELVLSSSGAPVRVRGIESRGRNAGRVAVGERCALNLAGGALRKTDVHRGDWVLAGGAHHPSRRIDARVEVLPTEERALRHWTPVHIHLGAADLTGRVALLEDKELAPGTSGLAQLVLDTEIDSAWGDRFILRDQSARRTIAGGAVIDPEGAVRGRARPERIEALTNLAEADPETALAALLGSSPDGLDLAHFVRARNLKEGEARVLRERLRPVLVDTRRGQRALHPDRWQAIRDLLSDGLRRWHEANPEELGPQENRLRDSLESKPPRELFAAALAELNRDGKVVREGALMRLPDHQPKVSGQDAALLERVARHLTPDNLQPPVVTALAGELGLEKPYLEAFLKRTAARGQLVRVVPNRFFHPHAVARLAAIAERAANDSSDQTFDAKTFRDQAGIGRNLTIQLLEFFDRVGLTRRIGDVRRAVRPASELFGEPGD